MSTDLDNIEISPNFGKNTKTVVVITTIAIVVVSIAIAYILFRQLGLVSMLSVLFGLMVSVIISSIFDLQITLCGCLGFVFGYFLNFVLHMYYLNVIKSEYAMGKKFTIAFTSGYKKALFNMLDILILVSAFMGLAIIIPSSMVKMFSYNMLMTIAGTAFTCLYLNKVVAVNYTAFNLKDEKKVRFVREANVDEIK